MIVARRVRKSDLQILKEAAAAKLRDLDRWLNTVQWDAMPCRVLGHKWHERRERNARTHEWQYVVRCKRCQCAAGFTASKWSHEDERAARRTP